MEWDVVIIGSGVGGGCVASRLADTGARILILERGERLPREPQNWDAEAVFVEQRYRTHDTWYDAHGATRFVPGQFYYVGGHTKFYGTAMFRFRERDFEGVEHEEGRLVPRGRSAMRSSSRGTRKPSACSACTGRPATIRPSRRARAPSRFRRSRTSRCIGEIVRAHARARPAALPHAGGDRLSSRRHAAFAAAPATRFRARSTRRATPRSRLIDPALQPPQRDAADRQPRHASAHRRAAASASSPPRSSAAARSRRIQRAACSCCRPGAINSAAILLRSADSKHPNGARQFLRHGRPLLHEPQLHGDHGGDAAGA